MADSVILDVRDLVVSFPLKRKADGKRLVVRAVNGVSFVLRSGQTLGIVGESGCGKSTLARALMNLIRPESGSVNYRSIDLQRLRGRALRRHRRGIQMVFQDPYASLDPKMTVGRSVTEALRANGYRTRGLGDGDRGTPTAPAPSVGRVPTGTLTARAGALLERVGIDPQRQSARPSALSGGERQRVGIARALGAEPDILICDEPTSALDVSVQAGVLNLLNELTKSLGLACIFISHDLNVVRHISDNVAVMYLGRIVECGPTEEVYRNPLHPYTKALLASAPTLEPASRKKFRGLSGEVPSPTDIPRGCPFRPRCPLARDVCEDVVPELAPVESEHHVSCHVITHDVGSA